MCAPRACLSPQHSRPRTAQQPNQTSDRSDSGTLLVLSGLTVAPVFLVLSLELNTLPALDDQLTLLGTIPADGLEEVCPGTEFEIQDVVIPTPDGSGRRTHSLLN